MQFTRVHLVVVALLAVLAYVVSQKLLPRKEGLSTKPIPTGVTVTGGLRELAQKQAGGKTARRGRYPWIVKISVRTSKASYSCTGFLINPMQVITANHCADDGVQPKDIRLYLGAYKDDGSDGEFHSVKTISLGGGSVDGNDWAVLTMNYAARKHTPVLVDGWNASVQLKKNMPVWSAGFGRGFGAQASFDYLQVNELRLSEISNDILQTANNVNGQPRMTCKGDSGGPLFIRGSDSSKDIVIGIVGGKTQAYKVAGQCTPGDGSSFYARTTALMAKIKASAFQNRTKWTDTINKTCKVTGRVLRNGKWSCSPRTFDAGVTDGKYTTPAGLKGKQCATDAMCALRINQVYKAAGANVNRVQYA